MSNISKCESCGGEVAFSPKSGNLECSKCHQTFAINRESFSYRNINMTGAVDEIKVDIKNVNLRCVGCGARFNGNTNNLAYVCEYCGSQLMENFNEKTSTSPDAIIPYAFDEDEARIKFKKNIAKKPFVPSVLKRQAPIDDIQSIYIPSFVFKCSSYSNYSGKLEKREDEEYHVFSINGVKAHTDEEIIIESSDYLTQTTLEEIKPYNMGDLCKFKSDFVRGYSLEHLNNSLYNIREQAKSIHEKNVRKEILSGYRYDRVKFLDIDTHFTSGAYAYTILPTYKISYTYKNKKYNTFMNGQTGKLCGNVPRSGVKIFFTILLSILAVCGVAYLTFFLTQH